MMINKKNDSYPWYLRIIFWMQTRKYGTPLQSAMLWAKSPILFFTLSMMYQALIRSNSPVSDVLRSMILIRVSQINGCHFCIDLNTHIALNKMLNEEKIINLLHWQSSTIYNKADKIALEYTEAVTNNSKTTSLRKELSNYYSEKEIIEITSIIAFQNMSTKFNNALDVKPQGFCNLSKRIK